MNELQIGQPSCYNMVYRDVGSHDLVITFTPTNGYFLYHNDLNANKLCITTTSPNYYVYNAGSACNKIVDFLRNKDIRNIICVGSSKAGLASILWAHLISQKVKNSKVFALSFSPQTQLYPFNENLYFPSYELMWKTARKNAGLEKCIINYGNLAQILQGSDLQGLLIYPKGNDCDRIEAERLANTQLKLIPIDYPLHGSFLPFMPQAKDEQKLMSMVEKIYENAKKDADIYATIPASKEELYELVQSVKAPTIDELIRAIFFEMSQLPELTNYQSVKQTGFL